MTVAGRTKRAKLSIKRGQTRMAARSCTSDNFKADTSNLVFDVF